jgi:hypothetical protein
MILISQAEELLVEQVRSPLKGTRERQRFKQ